MSYALNIRECITLAGELKVNGRSPCYEFDLGVSNLYSNYQYIGLGMSSPQSERILFLYSRVL
jgi:hypothetical protein